MMTEQERGDYWQTKCMEQDAALARLKKVIEAAKELRASVTMSKATGYTRLDRAIMSYDAALATIEKPKPKYPALMEGAEASQKLSEGKDK